MTTAIIQGAESGLFLKQVHELLLGADGFYDEVFRSLGVPYEAVQWRRDVNPVDREQAMLAEADGGRHADPRVPGAGAPDRRPRPAGVERAAHGAASSTRPPTGSTIWDLDREFLTERARPARSACRSARSCTCCATRTAAPSASSTCTSRSCDEQRWIQEQVEGVNADLPADDQRHILDRLNAAEAFETFLGTKYVGQKRFGLQGAESAIPILDAVLEAAADGISTAS